MPYKCVNCSQMYDDGSKEILAGCGKCHRKFFFYIKKEKISSLSNISSTNNEIILELGIEEKQKIEDDVREIAGITNSDSPIFLDFESVKVVREGKYLLDLSKLFSNKPNVYQLEDGKYIIDFSIFKNEEEVHKD